MGKSASPEKGKQTTKKRKAPSSATISAMPTKKLKPAASGLSEAPLPPPPAPIPIPTRTAVTNALSETHQSVLAVLKPKYDVLPALTISSTKIHKRVVRSLDHLRRDTGDPRPAVVLLHARPREVCKMITIAEQVKRALLAAPGPEPGRWFQYNMLYAVPPKRKAPDVVDETVLGGQRAGDDDRTEEHEDGNEEDDDADDYFEALDSRFQKAVVPERSRQHMSLSIFLSRVPIPELKSRDGVSVQVSEVPGDPGRQAEV
ncbi:hypothetical protein SODALDRAFT_322378 [Sodiomyces alkalinus F11]|uniref:DNA/RNA-binding protein Alba-like domain-containing protein n=1 Tax=Sodiomyces alkalinus (strain CBS 110278 / VKM F-3762 / F11) TaxID=1314773 RepID=A0A3N2Q343_SODAK|nr:hypothetical protein SODALDRAFT_322378 [Sodiomyces alkalinus F11]ROT41189.1 hypothetical protein SODALDRAFT_322378 [Sodiomyces alkalinus F11]